MRDTQGNACARSDQITASPYNVSHQIHTVNIHYFLQAVDFYKKKRYNPPKNDENAEISPKSHRFKSSFLDILRHLDI